MRESEERKIERDTQTKIGKTCECIAESEVGSRPICVDVACDCDVWKLPFQQGMAAGLGFRVGGLKFRVI